MATVTRRNTKLSRALSLSCQFAFHHISDIPEDSPAIAMLKECGTVLIVLSVLAIVGAGILSALFGTTKTRDDGLPRYKDLEKRMGKKAALAKAKQSLELPAEATEDEMIVALCKLDGQTLYVQHEDSSFGHDWWASSLGKHAPSP